MLENKLDEYFSTARERYRIKLKREAGEPWPWTVDPIFKEWSFCNVHREDDRTTVWFHEHVRKHLDGVKAAKATFIFRWFNRITTGEKIIDLLLGKWDTEEARRRLKFVSPIITGAYMLRTPPGMDKLDGVLYCIDQGLPIIEGMPWERYSTLREPWEFLVEHLYYVGPFMSYEIVTDLRHTPVLAASEDILTWANAGPGCTKGLSLVADEEFHKNSPEDQVEMNNLMLQLLDYSSYDNYWPIEYEEWEMREVEHWSCEYLKYSKAKQGYRLKRRYHHEGDYS